MEAKTPVQLRAEAKAKRLEAELLEFAADGLIHHATPDQRRQLINVAERVKDMIEADKYQREMLALAEQVMSEQKKDG